MYQDSLICFGIVLNVVFFSVFQDTLRLMMTRRSRLTSTTTRMRRRRRKSTTGSPALGPWQLFPSSTSCSAAVRGARTGGCSTRPPPPLGRALGRGSPPGPSPPLSKYKRHSKPSYHLTSSNTLRSSSRNSWQTRTTDPMGWGVGKWNATDASTVARHSHGQPISQGI